MKGKYQTIYKSSYGTVKANFKDEMTYEEAVSLGKTYCEENSLTYISTEKVRP